MQTRAEYECTTADSAAQADEILRQRSFDLALLDINIPGKTGMELLSDVKLQRPEMAVVMLTGQADASTAAMAMR